MTEELLKAILITSLAGSTLALVITLLRPLTKKLFGYKWHYYVWLAALVVMILPVRFTVPDLENGLAKELNINTQITSEKVSSIPVETIETPTISPPHFDSTDMKIDHTEWITLLILSDIWLLGILIMLSVSIIGYLRLIRKVHKKSVIISCPEIQKYTKRKITVRACEGLSSPFMFGIIKPTLVLPNIALTAEQLENILMHEMTHFKRNDILYKWFATLVKALHWFNPVVYYIAKQINTECEISCDLSVVKDMDSTQEMTYVNTIISLLAVNKSKAIPLTTGMTGNKKMLKRRFTMIKNKKTTSRIMSLLSALVAVVMLGTTVFASGVIANIYNADAASVGIIGEADEPTAVYKSNLPDNQIMFTGTIVENTLDTTTSAILVKPDEDSEIAYDTILFELTENQKDWVNKIGTKVQIVCYNSFQESLPPIGGLISIAEVKNIVTDNGTPENTIKLFFNAFQNADYETMKKYCTEECIKTYFHKDGVFGIERAALVDIEIDDKEYLKSSNDFNAFVTVDIHPAQNSIFDPNDKGTSFYVCMRRMSNGKYYIDSFATGL